MPISIAKNNDVPALVALINSAYRGEHSKKGWTTEADLLGGLRTDEETLASTLRDENSVMLIYAGEPGVIEGCVFLERKGVKLYLGMLTVSPEIQARGIGKQLLQAAEDYATQQHCKAVYMTVIAVRDTLIAWYERHGFKKTGETKPFPTDTKFGVAKQPLEFIVLEKTLV